MQVVKALRMCIYFAFFLVLLIPAVFADDRLDEALASYHSGISAKTNNERTAAFEKSLALYLSVYNDFKSEGKMNGMLCYNIGNCYFNLKQIGYAVYYYKLGLQLLPGNDMIRENLTVAIEKRHHPMDAEPRTVLETLLFFHYKMSTAKRIQGLIFFSWLTAVIILILLFQNRTLLKYLSAISFTFVVCLSLSLIFEYYHPEHKGVMIQTANARKDAGQGFAPIAPTPLGEGTLVRIIGHDEEWYQVQISGDRKGYIKKEFIKLII